LEAIVKYLHENKNLRLSEIAKLINRDQRAVGVTYRFARKKMKSVLKAPVSKYRLPVSVIADRRLSVLESVVYHLKKNYGLRYSDIALMLRRDDRTIWTVYYRALKKGGLKKRMAHKDAPLLKRPGLKERISLFKQKKIGYADFMKCLDEIYKYSLITKAEEPVVPVSVFDNEHLSALETIVKYLHENKQLRLAEIAKLICRDQRAIGVTYKFARRKMKLVLRARVSRYSVPLSVVAERHLSVLEGIVYYLKKSYSLPYCDIAVLLRRDERTIWTVYHRALRKSEKIQRRFKTGSSGL
jgi:hypothetical protein